VLGLLVNSPYGFAPQDNLAYAYVVRLHEAGIAQLNERCPAQQCFPPCLGPMNSSGPNWAI
jgi:hypothetical protein